MYIVYLFVVTPIGQASVQDRMGSMLCAHA